MNAGGQDWIKYGNKASSAKQETIYIPSINPWPFLKDKIIKCFSVARAGKYKSPAPHPGERYQHLTVAEDLTDFMVGMQYNEPTMLFTVQIAIPWLSAKSVMLPMSLCRRALIIFSTSVLPRPWPWMKNKTILRSDVSWHSIKPIIRIS